MQVLLIVVSGKHKGQTVRVVGPRFHIGQASNCHIICRGEGIARHHCVILSDHDSACIQGLDAAARTYVNGRRVKGRKSLQTGDTVTVGPFRFEVQFVESDATESAAASTAYPPRNGCVDETPPDEMDDRLPRDTSEDTKDTLRRTQPIVGVSKTTQQKRTAATSQEAAAAALNKLRALRS